MNGRVHMMKSVKHTQYTPVSFATTVIEGGKGDAI